MTHQLLTVVIDDDPSVCRALGRLLRSAGMEAETFTSGEDFLRVQRPREPDCLVLDIRLPGMSGPALREHLRSTNRPIPVVFITGHSEEENGFAGQGVEILRKPFGDQLLLDAIDRAIRRNGA